MRLAGVRTRAKQQRAVVGEGRTDGRKGRLGNTSDAATRDLKGLGGFGRITVGWVDIGRSWLGLAGWLVSELACDGRRDGRWAVGVLASGRVRGSSARQASKQAIFTQVVRPCSLATQREGCGRQQQWTACRVRQSTE